MKKTGILLILTLLALTVLAQKTKRTTDKTRQPMKHIEKFNIEAFNKNKKDGDWIFTMLDGTEVRQYGDAQSEYVDIRSKPNDLFVEIRGFYPNGIIKQEMYEFRNNGFTKGIIRYYDEQGKLTKTEDTDKPFDGRYPWELLEQQFIRRNKIDLHDSFTFIDRGKDKELGLYWCVTFDAKDGNRDLPYREVYLSGRNGKILKERRVNFQR